MVSKIKNPLGIKKVSVLGGALRPSGATRRQRKLGKTEVIRRRKR